MSTVYESYATKKYFSLYKINKEKEVWLKVIEWEKQF